MARQQYEFVRLVGDERRVGPTLQSVSRHWREGRECFLFVSPHDDDVIIGGGLMILAALREDVQVHVAVVTDGSMGYCTLDQKETISAVREKETYAACRALGVKRKNVHWLGYPDCRLSLYQGRRPAEAGDPDAKTEFTGLQHTFTRLLREIRPTQVFMPTGADLHPDHRIVYSEMMISSFHAAGAIWPELGRPLRQAPYKHEMAVYCNFPAPPKLRLTAPPAAFEKKLKSIGEFGSQMQIKAIIDSVRKSGPREYLRPADIPLYNPAVYRDMFEEPWHMGQVFH